MSEHPPAPGPGGVGRPRNLPRLRAPDATDELSRFPTAAPWAGEQWSRCHRERPVPDAGAWYFSAAPVDDDEVGGRFDVPAPAGTCYLAENALVALLEVVGPEYHDRGRWVTPGELDGRVVTRWRAETSQGEVADLLAPVSGTFVPAVELSATDDYEVTRAWAAAFGAAGADGIQYRARFSAGRALGWFGPAGPAVPIGIEMTDQPVPAGQVADESGVRVHKLNPADVQLADPTDPPDASSARTWRR